MSESSTENTHGQNVYAYNENREVIYIGNVPHSERGLAKRFFCLGCKRIMQAVKPQKKRRAYFRHHVKKGEKQLSCSYSDETYRHKLAKEILLRVKRIKVPSVYKYHPDKKIKLAKLIDPARFVSANNIVAEAYLVETLDGKIHVTKNLSEVANVFEYIKPDIMLLKDNGMPKLLVEFVATSKPSTRKLDKLRHFRIDAVEMKVPKDSPENIELAFQTTNRTKWLFNNLENETDYFQLPTATALELPEIDIDQRRIFEEGFSCRQTEINQTIRSIRGCLESEYYKGIERTARNEIQRIEAARDKLEFELARIRKVHRARSLKVNQPIEDRIKQKHSDLEKRYLSKRSELDAEEKRLQKTTELLESDIKLAERRLAEQNTRGARTVEAVNREKREIETIEKRIESSRQEYKETFEKCRNTATSEARSSVRLLQKILGLPELFRQARSESELTFKQKGRRIEQKSAELEKRRAEIKERYRKLRNRKEQEVANLEEPGVNSIHGTANSGRRWSSEECEELLKFKQALRKYQNAFKINEAINGRK